MTTLGTTVDRKKLKLDVDAVDHVVVAGSTGAGKSSLLRLLCERTYGAVQQIVFDYEGEFVTLRANGDYVLAGAEGDRPADPKTAKLLIRKAMELRFNLIVDLSDVEPRRRHEWVRNGCEALLDLPRELWHDVLVVLDEAHHFAPEGGKVRDTSVALDAVVDLVSRGRKRGIKLVLATQRLAKLSKDAAAECESRFIGRMNWPDDRKRAVEVLAAQTTGAAMRNEIARLGKGEFYVAGAALGGELVRAQLELPKSKPPPRGAAARAPAPPSEALLRVLKQLGDVPRQAEQRVRDLEHAQVRIRELEGEVAQAQRRAPRAPPATQKVEIRRIEVPVVGKAAVRALEALYARFRREMGRDRARWTEQLEAYQNAQVGLERTIDRLRAMGRDAGAPSPHRPLPGGAPAPAPSPKTTSPRTTSAASPDNNGDVELRAGARRMLQELARRYPLKLTRAQLGTLAGFTPRGGTFRTYFGQLVRSGYLVEQASGDVGITESGFGYVGENVPPAPATTDELLALWRKNLRAGAAKMLDVLVDVYPLGLSRAELGAESGFEPSGGTFRTYLGALHRNGLVVEDEHGVITASATLFIYAKRSK